MRTAAQTAFIMAVITLGSKVFGFAREMVMANFYGASYITDAYVMAIAIPSILLGGIFSAVSVAYMPIFSNTIEHEGEEKSNQFTSTVINMLSIIGLVAGLFGYILSDQIVSIFASGFADKTAEITSYFLRISFFYVIFASTSEILESFLRYKGMFIPQIAFGFIQNIILISAIAISAYTSYYYLIFGYLFVYILKLLLMFLLAKQRRFKYYRSAKIGPSAKKIMALSIPVFIGHGMGQINAFVDKTLASGLVEGSISALNYGYLLITMITGLTVTIFNSIIYPKISQASALGNNERLNNIVTKGVTLISMITLPCSIGAMVYSKQIVKIVYERGAFDAMATNMTASAFFYYSIGLFFIALNTLFTQVYYSKQDMLTPVLCGAVGVLMNIFLNLILVNYMVHNGLALATSVSVICNVLLLYTGMKRKYPEIIILESKKKLIKILIASVLSVGLSLLAYLQIIRLFCETFNSTVIILFFIIIFAGIVYLLLLKLFQIDEIKMLRLIFKK